MKKLLTDRLNELKSELVGYRQPKLTKEKAHIYFERVSGLNIRIDEVNRLIHQLK